MEIVIRKRKFSKYGFVWYVFVVCIFYFSFVLNVFILYENDVGIKIFIMKKKRLFFKNN